MVISLLLLIQDGQLSLTGKSMATMVNCLGGLSLPRNSVVRLTDSPDMTSAVYVDIMQQQQQPGTSC